MGRVCELCGGRNFAILHAWEAGNPWNPTAIPIAMWRCACGCTFLHPVPTSDQLPDQGHWWSEQRKKFSRKRRLKSIWNNIRGEIVRQFQGALPLAHAQRRTLRASSRCRILERRNGHASEPFL